jgi:hypothetical protein
MSFHKATNSLGEKRMAYRKLKIQATLLTLMLTASVALIGTITPARAQPGTIVYVDPPEVKDLFSPSTFTVAVKIANVQNLYGLDIQFTWDPTIIKYQSHVKKIPVETNPEGVLHSPTIPVRNQVDENASMPGSEPGTRYWVAEAAMLPAPVFNGNGTVFTMTFKVVGLGTSPLRITAVTLADEDGNPIPITIQNGRFINYEPPPADVFVNPPSIVNSSAIPGENFSVSVNLRNVQNLYGFEFWLDYNATMLGVAQVTANPAFPPPTVVQGTGQVKVSASLVSPTPPINGNLSLATIKFNVLAEGSTALDLHDVMLLDNNGVSINHSEPRDGYFNNFVSFKIAATVDVKPDVLNTISKSQWITVYIELSMGYDVNDIDLLTVKLNDTIFVDMAAAHGVGDFDGDTIPDLMVSFNRTLVISYIDSLNTGCYHKTMTFIVGGQITGGMMFEGSDTVNVSSLAGDANSDGVVNIIDITQGGLSYNAREGDSNWNANANFAPSYDVIDILDLVTATYFYGQTCP